MRRPADRLDGLHGAGGATGGVGGIEHHVLGGGLLVAVGATARGAVDEGVPRDGDHAGLLVALVDVHDHRRVGAGGAVVGAAAELVVGRRRGCPSRAPGCSRSRCRPCRAGRRRVRWSMSTLVRLPFSLKYRTPAPVPPRTTMPAALQAATSRALRRLARGLRRRPLPRRPGAVPRDSPGPGIAGSGVLSADMGSSVFVRSVYPLRSGSGSVGSGGFPPVPHHRPPVAETAELGTGLHNGLW